MGKEQKQRSLSCGGGGREVRMIYGELGEGKEYDQNKVYEKLLSKW